MNRQSEQFVKSMSVLLQAIFIVSYQIQQVFLYKDSHSRMCNRMDNHVYIYNNKKNIEK